jgi:solute carrier family 8 (sodium/calcium exchanger)
MLHPTIDDDGNIEDVACGDAIFHLISVFWKVVFSLNPPAHYGGGWPSFFGALFWIGFVTLIVAEIANLMGCVLGILPGVTAITFVAIGTSIPDTFASKIAAQQERYADEAVGNVTGSNSVNVFLGLGLPWIIATTHGYINGTPYYQKSKGLAQSVLLFIVVSLIGIMILVIRRFIYKGELGGPKTGKVVSASLFFLLWFVYVTISTLGSYELLFATTETA